MKTFKDFQETKTKMTITQFEKISNSSCETNDFREGNEIGSNFSNYVYVYKDFYYIDICNQRNIGYESANKKYGLVLSNEYFESNDLRVLEVKLYNDWFIDNVEGNDEWMYEVGIFTPHQSALYYKMFNDMNLCVEDITYSNDIVDTLRLSYGGVPICDVLLPNSAKSCMVEEKHNTFQIEHLDLNGERYDGKDSVDFVYENIGDLEDGLQVWFHQMARDYMDSVVDFVGQNSLGELPNTMSLDEFLIEYKDMLRGLEGANCYYKGNKIVGLHKTFKPLEDWYKFGCEPMNMFDSDNPIYDEKLCEDDVRNKLEMARMDVLGDFDKNGDAICSEKKEDDDDVETLVDLIEGDEVVRHQVKSMLSYLQGNGFVSSEDDDRIIGGDEREGFGDERLEECQGIVSINREGMVIDLSGNAYMDDYDNMVCNNCGVIVMRS